MKFKSNKGFTLIELLVVIAIIGILASVVLVALNSSRVKARDVRRLSDLRQITTAIELYYNQYGHYPVTASFASFDSPIYKTTTVGGAHPATTIGDALAEFISPATADPKSLGTDSGYLYTGNENNYCVLMYRTPENMNNFPSSVIPTNRCSAVDSAGSCTGANTTKAIYKGVGTYSSGC